MHRTHIALLVQQAVRQAQILQQIMKQDIYQQLEENIYQLTFRDEKMTTQALDAIQYTILSINKTILASKMVTHVFMMFQSLVGTFCKIRSFYQLNKNQILKSDGDEVYVHLDEEIQIGHQSAIASQQSDMQINQFQLEFKILLSKLKQQVNNLCEKDFQNNLMKQLQNETSVTCSQISTFNETYKQFSSDSNNFETSEMINQFTQISQKYIEYIEICKEKLTNQLQQINNVDINFEEQNINYNDVSMDEYTQILRKCTQLYQTQEINAKQYFLKQLPELHYNQLQQIYDNFNDECIKEVNQKISALEAKTLKVNQLINSQNERISQQLQNKYLLKLQQQAFQQNETKLLRMKQQMILKQKLQ